jgi:sensor histidine kinase YesM
MDILLCVEGFFLFYTVILISRYVYSLPLVKNRKVNAIYLAVWFVVTVVVSLVFHETPAAFHILFLTGYFFLSSPRKPSRALIIEMQIILMLFSLMESYIIFSIMIDENHRRILNITYAVIILAEILFMIFGEKWRLHFENENAARKSPISEKVILFIVSALVFLLTVYIGEYYTSVEETLDIQQKHLIGISSMLVVAIGFAVMVAVIISNRSSYYKSVAERNEQYLQLEMERYNAHKEMESETRRIRHDMKNHLLSIDMLLRENDYDKAREYISTITGEVENLTPDIQTGNVLADAILSDRKRKVEAIGGSLEVEGHLPKEIKIENVDLCAILANGMDNALEAVSQLPEEKRHIWCEFKEQGELIYMCLKNLTAQEYKGKTTKEDKKNHGFGLMNIRLAVEKYDGVMEVTNETENEDKYFILTIML